MRTLICSHFVSLDGVVEAPGGEPGYAHSGWTMDIEQDESMYAPKLQEALDAQTLLLGRRTYEGFSAAWPERDGEFADQFNSMEKVVVSTTLTDPAWNNTRVVPGVDEVKALRDGDGGPILVAGSGQLTHALYAAGLVDEWRLMVFPVILGSGLRLFPTDAPAKTKLTLIDSTTYSNGVQFQVLRTVS